VNKCLSLILGSAMFAAACGTTASNGALAPAATETRPAAATAAPAGATYREVTIPSGTALTLKLTSAVASETSKVYDGVSGELTSAITIDGRDVLPAGAVVSGEVTEAGVAGRVKGRAQVAFRFNTLMSGGNKYAIQTMPLSHMASLGPGADVSTHLTAPLTVRVRAS
jgi:hypothetical protein